MNWKIEQLWVKPSEGGYSNVVVTAAWRCTGTDQDKTGTVYGTASFPAPDGSFIPYVNLTQDQVLAWCWAHGVDKTAIEAAVQQQIAEQINPPVVTPALPWAA